METQGGLEMEDRRFFTGFVNEAGEFIKGMAAKWKMAQWLIEKLDQIVELGYEPDDEEIANSEELPSSWEQVLQGNHDEVVASLPVEEG